MNPVQSEEEARAFCTALASPQCMAQLELFAVMLAEENERQNLVANSSLDHIWQRHIADSLQLLLHVSRGTSLIGSSPEAEPPPWLDLGTGAGPPGLLIAIACPERCVHLVESRKRRVDWLNRVVQEFGLKKCTVHGSKLEDVESFECGVISARAFAPLPRLLKLSARFSTRDTVWLLPKGRSAAQELEEQPEGLRSLFHVEQSYTDTQAGILVGQGQMTIS